MAYFAPYGFSGSLASMRSRRGLIGVHDPANFCLILQISSRNPVFARSVLRICTEGEVQCHPSSHLLIEANTRIDGCSLPTPIPGLNLSLFVAYAGGSGCAVSNSRHRRPGKQADHVGRRGFHLRPRPLPGGFTRSTGLWKSHGRPRKQSHSSG
jgi:hypothetical protein